MGSSDRNNDAEPAKELLARVNEAKRASLRKLVIGTAYAIPAIASFSLAGLSTGEAATYVSNIG